MFGHSYKYDVAISVAEEDRIVADRIIVELAKRNIRYYYYKESAAESWGEYIIRLTDKAYGERSRFVLLITSSVFVQKYWSNIERQVALARRKRMRQHILQLQLDSTPVDGISKHVVSVNWQNNPAEIADLLAQKMRPHRLAKQRLISGTTMFTMLAGGISWYYLKPPEKMAAGQAPALNKIAMVIPASDSTCADSFYISSTEVTVAQFHLFCENERVPFPAQPASSRNGGPVRNVTWEEAVAFCRWSGGRLPKEKEWEYAAGGTSSTYSGGNNASRVAVYNRKKPDNVARKSPNAFGLYDMTGNVAEWCDDWYDSTHTRKVVRGGAYNSAINPVNELSVSRRQSASPGSRAAAIGFRVVWDK